MSKLKQLQNHLKENGWDAAFITTPDNVFYFSGFKSEPHERLLGVMVFKDAEPFLICPKMEMPDAVAAGWAFDVVGHEDTENAWDVVAKNVEARNVAFDTLAIEKSHLTVERLEAIQERYEQLKFAGIDEKINALRISKDEAELEKLRKAAELADYAIQVGCDAIAEGVTEMEVLNTIESAIKAKGYAMSFDTMVLAGEKAASPHGTPGNRKIKKGDLILFDLGVIYEGYCSDITRTVAFGQPNDEQIKIYNAVRRANESAIEAVKPGVRAMDLDKIARDVITDAGYGQYFTHRLGHGLGISVHEFPSINGANEFVLNEGTVFTIEPGIYKTDIAGVRIEDDVVVTNDGVEVLTSFTKELVIL
ncbi:Xaa-Pro aminopeptidase [Solibacillus silvestris StLB046]|uniref:Xaa-Pro aminopeptidase n=1 Tax=Solibacillus silvestris (strain StLB046) TaxID=1002809 RepID=F2F8W8_SOLSS|nr:Xaa-Pro peptidase family protein [Solibacillus silvestris]OBW59673.1 metallopeptidase [Solibacillus silvestris]BAK15595.1 Xaa-Pro aminopeptidase [Solibacillus silvestris StLB046]